MYFLNFILTNAMLKSIKQRRFTARKS